MSFSGIYPEKQTADKRHCFLRVRLYTVADLQQLELVPTQMV